MISMRSESLVARYSSDSVSSDFARQQHQIQKLETDRAERVLDLRRCREKIDKLLKANKQLRKENTNEKSRSADQQLQVNAHRRQGMKAMESTSAENDRLREQIARLEKNLTEQASKFVEMRKSGSIIQIEKERMERDNAKFKMNQETEALRSAQLLQDYRQVKSERNKAVVEKAKLEATLEEQCERSRIELRQRIATTRFQPGDLMLFIRNPAGFHEAYSSSNKSPNFFLARNQAKASSAQIILGEMVIIDENISSDKSNPFALPLGTTYYEVTAAIVE